MNVFERRSAGTINAASVRSVCVPGTAVPAQYECPVSNTLSWGNALGGQRIYAVQLIADDVPRLATWYLFVCPRTPLVSPYLRIYPRVPSYHGSLAHPLASSCIPRCTPALSFCVPSCIRSRPFVCPYLLLMKLSSNSRASNIARFLGPSV